jgi:alkanesulfonate monooxygenase SsuD/methylene tetrahydromethanopterin reductase-like flavin-dependent oxidoreductase (luciferase family)
MDESRERFDEAAPMILDALEKGIMKEHDGKYFKQPRAVIRPKPAKSFKHRVTQVAMSPESGEEAARLGAQMMAFNYKPPEQQKQEYEDYKTAFRKHQGCEPRPLLLTDFIICDSDADRARENAEKYIAAYCLSVMHHYELMGEHYKQVKGYSAYGNAVDAMREAGMENVVKGYIERQVWGTPDQMLRKFEERRELLGDFGVLVAVRFAGTPFEVAERSLKLFAEEVLPVLRDWTPDQQALAGTG